MDTINSIKNGGSLSIYSSSISHAWYELFKNFDDDPGSERSPVTVVFENFDSMPSYHKDVISIIDPFLKEQHLSVNTVANTIFPNSIWNKNKSREHLYLTFDKLWQRSISKCRLNRKGQYFRRMTHFDDSENGNQLESVIQKILQSTPHHGSRLWQIPIVKPASKDLMNANPPFPCLHQVGVIKRTVQHQKLIDVTAYYPTQYFVERAYGNWLGLSRLGNFIAHQTNSILNRIVCFVGKEILDESKTNIRTIRENLQSTLNEIDSQE